MPLIIEIDNEGNAHARIDRACAAHNHAKGHSGLYLVLGRSAMINALKKLDAVTTSSTETEVVAYGERFPKCTQFRYFRLAQGAEDKEGILFQNNKSTALLQKKHLFSIGRRLKYIMRDITL